MKWIPSFDGMACGDDCIRVENSVWEHGTVFIEICANKSRSAIEVDLQTATKIAHLIHEAVVRGLLEERRS